MRSDVRGAFWAAGRWALHVDVRVLVFFFIRFVRLHDASVDITIASQSQPRVTHNIQTVSQHLSEIRFFFSFDLLS